MDEEKLAEVRRYNRNIEISGAAIIGYGIWTSLKFFFPMLLGTAKIADVLEIPPDEAELYAGVVIASTVIVLGGAFLLHYLLGRAAIKFARGTKKSTFFVYWAVLLLLFNIASLFAYPETIRNIKKFSDVDTVVATLMVDITLIFILFDLIVSTYRLKKLRKQESAL